MGIKVTKECPECGKTITANRHRDTEKADGTLVHGRTQGHCDDCEIAIFWKKGTDEVIHTEELIVP